MEALELGPQGPCAVELWVLQGAYGSWDGEHFFPTLDISFHVKGQQMIQSSRPLSHFFTLPQGR